MAIKKAVPRFLNPLMSGQGYAKISYNNGTNAPVMVTQFKYRRPPGPWTTSDSACPATVQGFKPFGQRLERAAAVSLSKPKSN